MSQEKRILYALGEVDEGFITQAAPVNSGKKKKPVLIKWGVIAACFAVVVLGTIFFQKGLFGNRTDTTTLHNGEKLVFKQSAAPSSSFALDLDVTMKPLTAKEAANLFGDLPITLHALYKTGDADAGVTQGLLGFEGKIGSVKAVISTSDMPLLDTVIVGTEESSVINEVSITAGFFITDPNSKGERTAIYYASFALGSCKIYLENAGAEADRESIKNQLADAIQELIENGEPDLSSFDNEIGTALDGNPDGYVSFSNN